MEVTTMSKKMTSEEKQQRVEDRRAARKAEEEAARIEAERNQRPVKRLTITIEWKRSRMWGNNPHAEAKVEFWPIANQDTYDRRGGYTCSGCGYDKESTVIAEIFNQYLIYKLYEKPREWKQNINGKVEGFPYGVYIPDYLRPGSRPMYNGGVGTNCYFDIAKFIGGEFKRIASGSTFDVYEYADNEK